MPGTSLEVSICLRSLDALQRVEQGLFALWLGFLSQGLRGTRRVLTTELHPQRCAWHLIASWQCGEVAPEEVTRSLRGIKPLSANWAAEC